nr:reverse transcriptase domain-containing protein [Tanacetum cinerariifolium]
MRTRSQSRNNFPQQEASPVIVEPLRIELPFLKDKFQEDPPPEISMADNRTMTEFLHAPTEGYEDAIVIPEIAANNFELKHGLINLDSLNSAAGENFLDKMPRECLKIIVSKSKVRQSRAKVGSGTLPSNTITNPKEELKGITTQSGVAYQGPINSTQSKVVKQGTKVTKDQVQTPSSQSTAPVQPPVIQPETQNLIFEPVVAPVSAPMPNVKSFIPYPSRHDNEQHRDQANE